MGPPRKKQPETIGLQAEESGAFTLRVPAWLSRKAVAGLAAAMAASAGGAWFNVSRTDAVKERVAITDARMEAFTEDVRKRLDRMEAAQYTRSEADTAHTMMAKDYANADALLARDVSALNDRLRDVRRGERRTR